MPDTHRRRDSTVESRRRHALCTEFATADGFSIEKLKSENVESSSVVSRGVATGGIYTPKISLSKLFMG